MELVPPAWIRTSMALVAGGLGLLNLLPDQTGSTVLGLAVLAMAVVTSVASYRRWFRAERAMRQNQPLPPSQLQRIVTLAVATLALIGALLFVADPSRQPAGRRTGDWHRRCGGSRRCRDAVLVGPRYENLHGTLGAGESPVQPRAAAVAGLIAVTLSSLALVLGITEVVT